MAVLTILKFPDERLRIKADRVRIVDDEVKQLVENMFETMYQSGGIGLAATQVDCHRQVIVCDVSENKNEPLCFINPRIEEQTGEQVYEEGCLSVPEFMASVRRAQTIKVCALDRNGKPFTLGAEGLLSVCIQHEIDHLNGKLFIDYLSRIKRERLKERLKKCVL